MNTEANKRHQPTTWRRAGYTAFKLGMKKAVVSEVPENERDNWLQGYARGLGEAAYAPGKRKRCPHRRNSVEGAGWNYGWDRASRRVDVSDGDAIAN